ncbi:MAG: penicillin acylase family protein [Acidobacteriota bacterium]
MVLKRVLRYFNIAVGALLAAALLGTYWFAWRPLPKTSGTIEAPIAQRAVVLRDALGVPHITAGSIEDALFTQGFVTAQDRLWQMDILRRAAAGQLAEVLGADALEADRQARRFRLHRIAEAQQAALPAADRTALAAYTRGVNFFLEAHRGRLPVEFAILRYDPRPWSGVDSLLVGLYMFRLLSSTWEYEIQKSALLAGGDAAKVDFLFPVRAGAEPPPGSNAWALAGSRTATGKPLLASDPHLEYSLPGIWYAVHLQAPGLNVAGVSLPGVPCVIIGHNERIAWGMTNLMFDVQDLYREKLDLQTGRYLYRGQMEQARLEREHIRVRGAAPVELGQWVTRHGPVSPYALRWTAADTSGYGFPFLDLNRARDWQAFRAALSRFAGPPQNFVYADRDGNIGYQAAGRLPIRKSYRGDVPVDGSSGNYEWEGYIPFEELPGSYNPAAGLVVTANQNPFPTDYLYRVSGSFAPPYRSRQIHTLLSARKGWRAEEMLAIQKDVYSAFLHFLAREAAAAHRAPGDAVAVLREWNGQMDKDQAAPLVATLLYQHLRKAIVEKASPGKGLAYNFEIAPAVVEKLLRERPKDWFADYDQLLVTAFADAVEEGKRIQGPDVRKWSYGRYNQLVIPHPVLSRLPLIGKYFKIGPVPQSGSGTSVKQVTPRWAPSMRMVVDFSNFDQSWLNVSTGQSGQPLSSHFKDQWEAHYEGRSFPMQFEKVQAESTLTLMPGQ